MILYWSMFLVPAIAALQRLRLTAPVWLIFGFVLTLLIGLRFEVGGDWGSYRFQVTYHGQQSILQIIETGREPVYRFLNWIAYRTGMDVWFTNLVCALLFSAGLVSFARRLPEPFIAITVAIPYLVIVVAMGYTRQAAAIGIILFALQYYYRGKIFVFLGYLLFAALFHRTSIIFGVIVLIPYIQRRWWMSLVLLPIGYVLYDAVLADEQDRLLYTYVESEYANSSAGGLIRLALNAMFGGLFILIRNRLTLPTIEGRFWFWMSVTSIILFGAGTLYPTAADRFGVFLLPLQCYVSAHVPSLFPRSQSPIVRLLLIGFFALVLAVWIFLADNRFAWLPYTFWPLR